jgi:uncharacterized protein YbjT (DUF2867 family)
VRVVVLGARGGVGRQVVHQAAARGVEVVAAARAATEPDMPDGSGGAADGPTRAVERHAVDVRDPDAVAGLLRGADAVLWCVGVTRSSGPDVGAVALPGVVAGCREHGVDRLVSVSGAGVDLPGDEKGPGARFVSAVTHRLARALVIDKEAEHRVLQASGLVWTEVRPPRLSDGPATGRHELTTRAPGLTAAPVSRADVAAALLDLAVDASQWQRASPFIRVSKG